ncbi:MAG: hypothetical protein ACFHWX_06105 [Bacteroidota bacterium]
MNATMNKSNEDYFFELLAKIKTQYDESEIQKQKHYYSLTSTRLEKGVPLIVGFNWGYSKDYNHTPQSIYPTGLFKDIESEDLGSLKRTIPYFNEYFQEGLNAVQTNICFFRSPRQHDIYPDDVKLCLPIFNELVSFLNPSAMISFTKSILDYIEVDQTGDKIKMIKSGSRNISAIKSTYDSVPFYYLPHPNYPCTREARNEVWNYCFR